MLRVLPFLIGFLIFSEAQAQLDVTALKKVVIMGRVFEELGIDMYLYLNISREMETFAEVGLDTLAPIKSRGLDYSWMQKGHDAFNTSNAILTLIGTGVSEEKAFFALACAKKKNLKIGERDYPKLLLYALRETGQDIDSLTVDKAAKAALILDSKTGNGLPAYFSAGINIDAIPSFKKD